MVSRPCLASSASFFTAAREVQHRLTLPSQVLTDTPEIASDTIVYLTQTRQTWLAGRYVSCTWDMPEFFAKKDEVVERDLLKVGLRV